MRWVLLLVWLVFGTGVTLAESTEDYIPLYNYGQKVNWCSQNCPNECEPSFLCYYAPPGYDYFFSEIFYGFKKIYNPLDPRIVCRYEPGEPENCVKNNLIILTYQICREGLPGCRQNGTLPAAFRLFLPPGTKSFNVLFHYARDALAGVAVRFGAPPEAYANLPQDPDKIPWHLEGPVTLEELEGELFYRNNGGSIYFESSLESESVAGWLYFRLLPQFRRDVHEFQLQIKVDYQVYRAWFESVRPCPAKGYCWDYLGNPKGELSCDADHLYACQDAFACINAGGYWYDGACHDSPCDANHLYACPDAFACINAGGYWCDGQCQAQECQGNFVPPVWDVSCQTSDGVAKFLVLVSSCGSLCGRMVQVKVAATDPLEWQTIDYSWLPGEGWVPGDRSFEMVLGTLSPVDLLEGYELSPEALSGWYAGVMIDLNGDGQFDYNRELRYCQFPEARCDAAHLDLCRDETSCEKAGGYWSNGRCQALPCEVPENQECQLYEEGTCQEAGCGWAPGKPGRCYSCLAAINENSCLILEGCRWDGKHCLPEGCSTP